MTQSASMSTAGSAPHGVGIASSEPSAQGSAGLLITPRLQRIAERAAGVLLRYGVVAMLLLYGAFKLLRSRLRRFSRWSRTARSWGGCTRSPAYAPSRT